MVCEDLTIPLNGIFDRSWTSAGRYVFDLGFDNIIKAAVVAHPSLLKIPDDLKQFVATSKAPLLINSAEIDEQYPPESQTVGDQIFGNGKYAPGYKRE